MIHDGWIALTIAAVADVVAIEEPLIQYRQHGRQQIGAPARVEAAPEPQRIQAIETAFQTTKQQRRFAQDSGNARRTSVGHSQVFTTLAKRFRLSAIIHFI